jgi:DNA-binding MarR family transcriptional regulator
MYNLKASDYGGTMAIGYALLNIDKEGTPSTKLGPKMGMEPRSMTRMIKSLEKNGLIEKKSDKKDKRMVRLFLTDSGNELRKKSRDVVIKFNEKIFETINPKELDTCFKVLKEINLLIDENHIFTTK